MRIQFRVSICDDCRLAAREHVAHEGVLVSMVELRAGEAPRLPGDCKCALVPVGACSLCERSVDDLPPAALANHFDYAKRNIKGEEIQHTSICAECVLDIVGMMQHPQIGQHLASIVHAMQPKIVPASAIPTAQEVASGSARLGGRVVPIPQRTRRH